MYIKNHNRFILSPVSDILKDVVSASAGIGNGIEANPVFDYMMQSVFLKMTGAQEQKVKCICWELATNDYEYRYDRYTKERLGECSTYDEKKKVYKDLIGQIKKTGNQSFDIKSIKPRQILNQTNTLIDDIFKGTNLAIWGQRMMSDYKKLWQLVTHKHFATQETVLFNDNSNTDQYSLKKMYENHLYKQRNRTAHNTLSYQQNLPTLNTLVDENFKYNNYFIYFSILILIDLIFVDLYKTYLKSIEDF